MQHLVSIIMPAYNMAGYIEQSIASVQAQTYQLWELIIVNDGSRDTTAEIAEKYTRNDKRIKLINQHNSGVSAARNRGIKESKGRYISFLDADDLWYHNCLEELVNALVNNSKADLAYCGYERLLDSGKIRNYKYKYCNGKILLDTINETSWVPIQGILVNRDLLIKKAIEFPEGCSIGEDLEFLFKILSIADAVAVPKTLVTYRLRTGSASQATGWRKQLQVIDALCRVDDFIKNKIEGDQYIKVSQALSEKTAYSLFRIAWKMLKNKELHTDVLSLLTDKQYAQLLLHSINLSKMKFRNRLQYKILTSRSRMLWRIFS